MDSTPLLSVSSLTSAELSDDALLTICEQASVIACKCPAYLVALLRSVREFRTYTAGCATQFPEDTATHEWLSSRATEVELLLTRTVIELLQREELLDEQQQIDLKMLAERNRSAISP